MTNNEKIQQLTADISVIYARMEELRTEAVRQLRNKDVFANYTDTLAAQIERIVEIKAGGSGDGSRVIFGDGIFSSIKTTDAVFASSGEEPDPLEPPFDWTLESEISIATELSAVSFEEHYDGSRVDIEHLTTNITRSSSDAFAWTFKEPTPDKPTLPYVIY